MKEFLEKINQPKYYLLAGNIFVVIFLIIFSNFGWLPLKSSGDFIFLVFIFFAFALYRPGWAFLLFVGTVALENINLAPVNFGVAVRPYQFIGALTFSAVAIKFFAGRLGFDLPKLKKHDWLAIFFAAAGFMSALGASDQALAFRQSIIASSFVALYFLVRVFIQNLSDIRKIIPFFLSSSLVIVLYGLYQNIAFQRAWRHFEVMPGRPNATFSEPDWLGIYLVLLLAVFYALMYQQRNFSAETNQNIRKFKQFYLHSCLALVFILLIITVSRSAWLGALAVTMVYLFSVWTDLKFQPRHWQWRPIFWTKVGVLSALLAAIAVVYLYDLTSFQLFNRFESTGTGLQKITVACRQDISLPEKISRNEELMRYDCRHINLEEIPLEQSRGYFIKETYRIDPNVNVRQNIYSKSLAEVKKHPVLGIGWGNIGKILGTDEKGTTLNASNIFLETWLGAGFAGLLLLAALWLYAFLSGIRSFRSTDPEQKAFGVFLILGFFALLVPNFFNAGIFLGFLWLFLGIII